MTENKNYSNEHPRLAQVAIQQRLLAQNLKKLNQGKSMPSFRYKNLGIMATVRRNKAITDSKLLRQKINCMDIIADNPFTLYSESPKQNQYPAELDMELLHLQPAIAYDCPRPQSQRDERT